MSDVNLSERKRLEALLEEDISVVDLRRTLQSFSSEFLADQADLWAPAVYERDPEYFTSWLIHMLTDRHAGAIRRLLPRLEADKRDDLFKALYLKITDNRTWNEDLLALAQSDEPDEVIQEAVQRRGKPHVRRYYIKEDPQISEEAALALYRRNPSLFSGFVQRHLTASHLDFATLREEAQKRGDFDLYWLLFRKSASAEQWLDELDNLLQQNLPADSISDELHKRHPERDIELEDASIWDAFLDKYGNALFPYLWQVKWYVRLRIRTLIDHHKTAQELLEGLEKIARHNYRTFRDVSDLWAPHLYEHYPEESVGFLMVNLGRDTVSVVRELLPGIEAAGNDALFSALYRQVADRNKWDEEILALARSDLTDDEVMSAIRRRELWRGYMRLSIPTALALVRRNPVLFRTFIRDHVSGRYKDAGALLAEVEGLGDEELYWQLFRKVADNRLWGDALARLYELDVPADDILFELERRHPHNTSGVSPDILAKFLERYGAAIVPYLERYTSTVSERRLKALLNMSLDRGTLRRELELMGRQNRGAFVRLADIWAPALYHISPEFFGGFLNKYLNDGPIVYQLLARAEQDGHDRLFRMLYRKIARHDEWDREIRELARSDLPDEEVNRRIARRSVGRWFSLSGKTALDLYQRNPDVFRDFVRGNVRDADAAQALLQHIKPTEDDSLHWHLFRVASPGKKWREEMERLYGRNLPSEAIAGELKKRAPRSTWNYDERDFDVWQKFLRKYGEVVVPYIEAFARHRRTTRSDELLAAAQELESPPSYWRIFFQVKGSDDWNSALREFLGRSLTKEELLVGLQLRTPEDVPPWQFSWSPWRLDPDVALYLYRRDPEGTRPFLTRFLHAPNAALYDAALESGDEEFVDFITFLQLQHAATLVLQAYPTYFWGSSHQRGREARQELEEMGAAVVRRFRRLYNESPERYVRHAANVLGHFRPFAIWNYKQQIEHNPILAYLAKMHHEHWRRSPDGIRELMESPNIYVNLIALDILDADSLDAARRVLENLGIFRALLLGRARRSTKKQVLNCLARAARQGGEFADYILPLLEETMDFRGRRAISEELMIQFVRLSHELGHTDAVSSSVAAE